ncbi:ABC transporter substrate-binding protein [Streptomyces boninensis]|uniref:ABC transporter substrate-binding protein n=1 Tax=Streptomyces boninensis TaxID=2039455 RepID=UPI003B211E83
MGFRTRIRTRARVSAAATLALAAVAGCGSGAGGGSRTVSYWLWDAAQLPAYQACAKDFEAANPGLKINIVQVGWNDYWTKLTSGFIAGTQPDVFTNHLQKFPQFVDLEVLEPLDGLAATKGIRDADYQPGLGASWKGQDGHRYGAPKDWDTVGLYFNKKMVREAGVSEKTLNNLDWNPRNGGSFEKTIAHLTIDNKGRRGDEKGFDKNNVKVYGLATGSSGDADGQSTWSPFTGSTGWHYTDKKAWGTRYNYDDKKFQTTIAWYFGLAKKGYMPPFTVWSDANPANVQLGAQKAAISINGSWMSKSIYGVKGMKVGTALTPKGPSGQRATMMNGLADSITKGAKNKAGAAKWVAYLASEECQRTVGKHGIVFPARPGGTEAAIPAFEKQGIDVDAFTKPVADKTTFSFPITNYAADVFALMKPAMQDIYANDAPVTGLDTTNDQINFLLSQ